MLIFITGGVRSGKSSFAERKAMEIAEKSAGQLNYIATGVASDNEMSKRILRHQLERNISGFSWQTWEQPFNIGELKSQFSSKDILLLDCITTLLNNEYFRNEYLDQSIETEIIDRIITGIHKLSSNCHTLIVVSNEVLYEPLQSNLIFSYGRLLGDIHQQIVKKADQAYLVEAGIPILMKGEII